MSMLLALKALVMVLATVVVVPVVFALTLLLTGSYFALSISKDSWLATSKNRFIRAFVARCA